MRDIKRDPDLFRDVIGRFASGVTVVTASLRGTDFGMTANAVCSVSLEPPMVLVCVNRRAPTSQAVSESGAFAVNILHEDQTDLAIRFATPLPDKFEGVDLAGRGKSDCPLLDRALARLECRVIEETAGGTHSVFFGEVERAEAREGKPLAYFRGRFGQLHGAEDDPVAAALRTHLLGDRSEAGVRLESDRLAAELGIPAGDIARALTALVSDGFVSRDPENGYVIAPVDATTIDQAFDARCAIELGAAELAFARDEFDILGELRADMEGTRPLIQAGRFVDLPGYARANARFHETLVRSAGSQPLLEAYRRLSLAGIMLRALSPSSEASDELIDEHERIVEAFESGSLEATRAAIQQHTETTKRVHDRALTPAR